MMKIINIMGWIILILMIVNDAIFSQIQEPSMRDLRFSNLLQAVLDFNTRIFRGQGVSAAIIIEDRGHWAGTSGYSEPGKPIDEDMLFNIGSIGKNFLATLILQLAEEERLSLDDPLGKWELGSPTVDKNITVRQLLNHTSGVFDWVTHHQSPFNKPYRQIDYERAWSQDEVLSQLSGKPYFPPGNGWHYSTTNYNLLKIIAEKVTGTTVSVEIQNRFLQPLGLAHTIAMDVSMQIPAQNQVAHSWLDVNGDGETEDISTDAQTWITSMSPNMMYASAFDLARWSQALYGGKVLSESSLDYMLDFHRPTPNEPPLTGYGLGTAEIAIKSLLQSYGHLGYHYGNMSAMLYFPKLRASIVVLTNENNQPFQYGVSFSLLAVILLWKMRYFLCLAVLGILTVVGWKRWKHKS
jgi:D-alanyl-D-alanine carboxypeptidase